MVGACGAAIVVAGMTGCSSKDKSENPAASTPAATSVQAGGVSASAGAGTAKVTIDGQPKEMQGQVVCTPRWAAISTSPSVEAGSGVARRCRPTPPR